MLRLLVGLREAHRHLRAAPRMPRTEVAMPHNKDHNMEILPAIPVHRNWPRVLSSFSPPRRMVVVIVMYQPLYARIPIAKALMPTVPPPRVRPCEACPTPKMTCKPMATGHPERVASQVNPRLFATSPAPALVVTCTLSQTSEAKAALYSSVRNGPRGLELAVEATSTPRFSVVHLEPVTE